MSDIIKSENEKTVRYYMFKTGIMLAGSFLMGTGIGLAISTGLGADPLAWVWQGMERHLGITLLQANLLLSAAMLIPPVMIDRSHIGVGTIVQPVVLGISNSFMLEVVNSDQLNPAWLPAGLLLLGVGAGIYNSAGLGRNSYDCCVFMLSEKLGTAIGKTRSFCDLTLCAAAFLMCGKLVPGPIAAIVCVGPVLHLTLNHMEKLFQRLHL